MILAETPLVEPCGTDSFATLLNTNPTPVSFPLIGEPTGMAINKLDHHWFVADARNDNAAEYSYPRGKLIGTVPGNPNGIPQGVAVDP